MKAWMKEPIQTNVNWFEKIVFVKKPECLDNLLGSKNTLDELISQAAESFKDGRATTVVPINIQGTEYILKRYNARSALHTFSRAFRKTRAKRCWQRSFDFACAGINVAAPVLMYEQRIGPVRLDAYFLCEKLYGSELLSVLPTMDKEEQQSVFKQMKRVFEKMRTYKLTHGDLKATNIMWVNGELFFIDLDAARKHSVNNTWAHSHAKDRKRFMKNWQNHPELLRLFEDL